VNKYKGTEVEAIMQIMAILKSMKILILGFLTDFPLGNTCVSCSVKETWYTFKNMESII